MDLINLTDKIYQTVKMISEEKKELEELAKEKAGARSRKKKNNIFVGNTIKTIQ